jgi:hypothetical protein
MNQPLEVQLNTSYGIAYNSLLQAITVQLTHPTAYLAHHTDRLRTKSSKEPNTCTGCIQQHVLTFHSNIIVTLN